MHAHILLAPPSATWRTDCRTTAAATVACKGACSWRCRAATAVCGCGVISIRGGHAGGPLLVRRSRRRRHAEAHPRVARHGTAQRLPPGGRQLEAGGEQLMHCPIHSHLE